MKEALNQERGEKIEASVEKQEKKTIKHIGSQRNRIGLTLWEYNESTGEIKEAEYHKETLVVDDFSGRTNYSTLRKKVISKQGCLYVQALNKKSASRKILKQKI